MSTAAWIATVVVIIILVLFFFWEPIIPIMIIALFFDIRYSFTGKDDLSSANKFMDKVGSMAEEVTG